MEYTNDVILQGITRMIELPCARFRLLACAKFLRKLGILPCSRARAFLIEIRTTYQHHLFFILFFDRLGNFEATKVLIMLIPGVLGTATRPPT